MASIGPLMSNVGITPSSERRGQPPGQPLTSERLQLIATLLPRVPPGIDNIEIDGETKLTRAVAEGNEAEARSLVKAGASLVLNNDKQQSPLTVAVRSKNENMVRCLHSLGADMDRVDGEGWTPLTLAASQEDESMIRCLHSLGTDVDKMAPDGWTPLTLAIAAEFDGITNCLLELGANPNKPTIEGKTPLRLALYSNSKKAVEMLLKFKADPNGSDPIPYLAIAKCKGKLEICAMLEGAGADGEVADEALHRMMVANLWGIVGQVQLHRRDGSLVTMDYLSNPYPTLGLEMMKLFLPSFLKTYCSFEDQELFKNVWDNSVTEGSEELDKALEQHQRGLPVVVISGFTRHVIVTILIGKYVFVCNRGAACSKPGVTAYQCSEDPKAILEALKKKYNSDTDFLNMLESFKLNEEKGLSTPLKDQKCGNCPWASVKAALCALFTMRFGREKGLKLYKEFTLFARTLGLKLYRTKSKQLDQPLVDACKAKFAAKEKKKPGCFDKARAAVAKIQIVS